MHVCAVGMPVCKCALCVYLEKISGCLKSIICYASENLIFGILKIKRNKLKRKVKQIKRRVVKEGFFSPEPLALYNLFIFSAQEDHA